MDKTKPVTKLEAPKPPVFEDSAKKLADAGQATAPQEQQTVETQIATATTAVHGFKNDPLGNSFIILCVVIGLLVSFGILKKKPWQKFFQTKK